jgi:hypothetical protein
LNATAYRSSANAFDGLGEAYEKDGDRTLAIRNTRRPSNSIRNWRTRRMH